jgi:hypothetical protein
MDGQRVRVLLPGVGNFDAMAEEALVAGHVLGYRLADVILGGERQRAERGKRRSKR